MNTLIGSEKQIKWANEIRNAFMSECNRQIENAQKWTDPSDDAETIARRSARIERVNLAIEVAGKITKAAYWIDFRTDGPLDLELHWRNHRQIIESRGM